MTAARATAMTALPAGVRFTARGDEFSFRDALLSCAGYTDRDGWRRMTTWDGRDNRYHGSGVWLSIDGAAAEVRGLAAWREPWGRRGWLTRGGNCRPLGLGVAGVRFPLAQRPAVSLRRVKADYFASHWLLRLAVERRLRVRFPPLLTNREDLMSILALAMLASSLSPADVPAPEEAIVDDRLELQGRWVVSSVTLDGRECQLSAEQFFVFDGDEVCVCEKIPGASVSIWSYVVNASKSPRYIDIVDNSHVMRGIYRVTANHLEVAFRRDRPRPQELASNEDSGVTFLVLHRAEYAPQRSIRDHAHRRQRHRRQVFPRSAAYN